MKSSKLIIILLFTLAYSLLAEKYAVIYTELPEVIKVKNSGDRYYQLTVENKILETKKMLYLR